MPNRLHSELNRDNLLICLQLYESIHCPARGFRKKRKVPNGNKSTKKLPYSTKPFVVDALFPDPDTHQPFAYAQGSRRFRPVTPG